IAAGQLLERGNHSICIEASFRKVDVGIRPNLQLSALLCGRRVNACGRQALQVVLTLILINNVNGLMSTLESVFYEWEQDPILFVRAVKESADMTRLIDLGTGKRNGCDDLHRISPDRSAGVPRTAKKNSTLLNLLDSALVELLLVALDPGFRLRRKNIKKLSLARRDHVNHFCDHVLRIESPLGFTEQPGDHFLEGVALDEVHVIAHPT